MSDTPRTDAFIASHDRWLDESEAGHETVELMRALERNGNAWMRKCGWSRNRYDELLAEGWQWQPMDTAPKDGTLVLLLIAPSEERDHALEDTAEASRTIGHNNFDNDGEDRWQFAGWCWSHDHYTEGEGMPSAWAPLLKQPSPVQGDSNG